MLIDHGSRRDEANAVLTALGELVRAQTPEPVWIAHLEIAAPSIAQAVAQCAAAGMRELAVVPLFLTPGTHVCQTLPAALAAATKPHGITFRVAPPLGAHSLLAALLVERAAELRKVGGD